MTFREGMHYEEFIDQIEEKSRHWTPPLFSVSIPLAVERLITRAKDNFFTHGTIHGLRDRVQLIVNRSLEVTLSNVGAAEIWLISRTAGLGQFSITKNGSTFAGNGGKGKQRHPDLFVDGLSPDLDSLSYSISRAKGPDGGRFYVDLFHGRVTSQEHNGPLLLSIQIESPAPS